jgi:hypothetical protein
MGRYANAAERKIKAIKLMKKLDIYKPYIEDFEENNTVCFYENYAGFWAYQEPEVQEKITELEILYDITIYAITHEFCEFGECYSFLYVNKYKEEWDYTLESEGNLHNAFAYVWNKTDDWCSEFGTIGVRSFGGGIKRIA